MKRQSQPASGPALPSTILECAGMKIPVFSLNTVIVGSGAAGLNCAVRLAREFEKAGMADPETRVALVTRGIGLGTSNNSGSDKQTYYKLGTDSADADCPFDMARTLAAGGCMHGDVALAEAASSARSFHHLADIGVPFPHDSDGCFVGYKTDHDPKQRATSAGPWTSRYMVQKLLAEVRRLVVPIFNRYHMLAVITRPETAHGSSATQTACGILCARVPSTSTISDSGEAGGSASDSLILFNCRNVVVAGGGPGDLYETSVYPEGQMGPYAALFEAGVAAQNLTESQFGLASLHPRWNLSGTYQQVIPRYYSTNQNGEDPEEFLNPWFDSMSSLATAIFLKGYQWPFDPDKVENHGSSLIDILVQRERVHRGRRVFMDFRKNPVATGRLEDFSLQSLEPVALAYLQKSGAMQSTPIERLSQMNPLSIDLYREKGIDLWGEPLEVGVCAQHCNGGFVVDKWWESNVRRLFVIGELAGTHGVKRPGGSALNAGQVGGLRAAQRIAHVYGHGPIRFEEFADAAEHVVIRFVIGEHKIAAETEPSREADIIARIRRRMSHHAAMARSLSGVEGALGEAREEWWALRDYRPSPADDAFLARTETRELALAQIAFLEAIRAYLVRGGGSRGSYLVIDPATGRQLHPALGNDWHSLPENPDLRKEILLLQYDVGTDSFRTKVATPNEIPQESHWFETTWADYREGKIFRNPGEKTVGP